MIPPKIYSREDGSYIGKYSFNKIKFHNNKGNLNQEILNFYIDQLKPNSIIDEEDQFIFLYLISEGELLPELIDKE